MKKNFRPTIAEIDLGSIAHNLKKIKNSMPGSVKMLAIVKANGYGHGMLKKICDSTF